MGAITIPAILLFIARLGIKAATKKYGKKIVDEAIKKKSTGQQARNYIKKTDTSVSTAPQSVSTRINNVDSRIASLQKLIREGKNVKAGQKRLEALKKQRNNLMDMAEEDPDILGGPDSMYGKFNKGGMIDYRKKGLFR